MSIYLKAIAAKTVILKHRALYLVLNAWWLCLLPPKTASGELTHSINDASFLKQIGPGFDYELENGRYVWNPNISSSKPYKGKITEHNFINVLVSKRGYTQVDSGKLTNMKSQIGLGIRVDFKNNQQTLVYNTSDGEKVNIESPFNYAKDYGTDIVFKLK